MTPSRRAAWISGLSLLPTPLLLLASANEIYLRNQQELDGTLSVLFPFWAGALSLLLCGTLLLLHPRSRLARLALWAYYLLGVFFLGYQFLWNLQAGEQLARWLLDRAGAAVGGAVAFAAATLALSRRWRPERAAPPLAVFGLVLLAGQSAGFASRVERAPVSTEPREQPKLPAVDPRLGNVYHLILDAYQAELFDHTLPPRLEREFDGFVRFPETRALESGTVRSLPTILLGRPNPPGPADRFQPALSADASLLTRLRRQGYVTLAYIPPRLYPKDLHAFDRVVFHDENLGGVHAEVLHQVLFWRLWLFSVLPPSVTGPLVDHHVLRLPGQEKGQRLSTYVQPALSYQSFRKLLKEEAGLPATGRYTWIHLLVPHSPFLLDGNCSIHSPSDPTGPLEQTQCATQMVALLAARLRELARFDASTIVVQGDHGMGLRWEAGRLVKDESASLRTLLMIKPAGARGALRTSARRASLLDVAPTLLACLGMTPEAGFQGHVLEEALPRSVSR